MLIKMRHFTDQLIHSFTMWWAAMFTFVSRMMVEYIEYRPPLQTASSVRAKSHLSPRGLSWPSALLGLSALNIC